MPDARHDETDPDAEPYSLALQAAAVVALVVAGLVFKSWLLNGLTGPLFVFALLYLLPTWLRGVTRSGRRR